MRQTGLLSGENLHHLRNLLRKHLFSWTNRMSPVSLNMNIISKYSTKIQEMLVKVCFTAYILHVLTYISKYSYLQ